MRNCIKFLFVLSKLCSPGQSTLESNTHSFSFVFVPLQQCLIPNCSQPSIRTDHVTWPHSFATATGHRSPAVRVRELRHQFSASLNTATALLDKKNLSGTDDKALAHAETGDKALAVTKGLVTKP